jgi:hypothetical protein
MPGSDPPPIQLLLSGLLPTASPRTSTAVIAVQPDDLRAAAEHVDRALSRVRDTPTGLLAGAHSTHAAALDQALSEFRVRAADDMQTLADRADYLAGLLAAAADRFSVVESFLAVVLS